MERRHNEVASRFALLAGILTLAMMLTGCHGLHGFRLGGHRHHHGHHHHGHHHHGGHHDGGHDRRQHRGRGGVRRFRR